jgi:hypothetical protein
MSAKKSSFIIVGIHSVVVVVATSEPRSGVAAGLAFGLALNYKQAIDVCLYDLEFVRPFYSGVARTAGSQQTAPVNRTRFPGDPKL